MHSSMEPFITNGESKNSFVDGRNECYSGHVSRSSGQVSRYSRQISQRSSMQESNPGTALRKIVVLFESHKLEECLLLTRRLSNITLRSILAELPIEEFIKEIPETLGLLETLYARFYNMGEFSVKYLKPEKCLLQIIEWLSKSSMNSSGPDTKTFSFHYYEPVVKHILDVIFHIQPQLKSQLQEKKMALNKCIEGLGNHGLVNSSDEKLVSLHDALKKELQSMVHQLKIGVQKLEELNLAHRRTITQSLYNSPAPIRGSHQRMMQVTKTDVMERLIKHKTLLNVVEPATTKTRLDELVRILNERIESDKEVLFHFSGLRKDMCSVPNDCIVAPLFQQFATGHDIILTLAENREGFDVDSPESGYGRTDSETSGKWHFSLIYVLWGSYNQFVG